MPAIGQTLLCDAVDVHHDQISLESSRNGGGSSSDEHE